MAAAAVIDVSRRVPMSSCLTGVPLCFVDIVKHNRIHCCCWHLSFRISEKPTIKIQLQEKSLIAGNETEARRCLQALGRRLARHLSFEGFIRTISGLAGWRQLD